MKRLFLLLTAFSLVFIASGCGQSGPLYIPGNPSKIQNPPPAEEQDEEEKEKEKEEDSDSG